MHSGNKVKASVFWEQAWGQCIKGIKLSLAFPGNEVKSSASWEQGQDWCILGMMRPIPMHSGNKIKGRTCWEWGQTCWILFMGLSPLFPGNWGPYQCFLRTISSPVYLENEVKPSASWEQGCVHCTLWMTCSLMHPGNEVKPSASWEQDHD
jgi:hypothetical protein